MTNHEELEETPFGGARSRMSRIVAMVLGVALIVAAIAVTMQLSKGSSPAAVDPGAHDHAAMLAAAAPATQGSIVIDAQQAERIGITFATAARGPTGREVRTLGTVVADDGRVHTVALRVNGFIEEARVSGTGERVNIGDTLFRVYSPEVSAAAGELTLALRLIASLAGGTPEARAAAESLAVGARHRLLSLGVPDAMAAGGDIRSQGSGLTTFPVLAPVSGYVLERNVNAGSGVMMGQPLARIADLSVVWVEGEVFERDIPAVRVGQVVTAHFEALPESARRGRITLLQPTLSSETRTMRVRVPLSNQDGMLRPGMFATLTLDADAGRTGIVVPRGAVLFTGERSIVFVREQGGALRQREVVVGSAFEGRIEILAGLTEGETVVAAATFLVDAESSLRTLSGGAR